MGRELTDAELRQVAEYVARRYLEVERGLRGKQCLRRLLSDEAYDQQSDPATSRFGNAGVVRQRDLGRITLQRPRADRVHVAIPARQQGDRWGALVMSQPAWTFDQLTALLRRTDLPFVVKGVMTAEDARRCVDIGAAGLVVSNHGGRQLDCAPGTLEQLPEIAEAVSGQLSIALDGGIRRGTDVVKALALGADVVVLGRLVATGLAAGGVQAWFARCPCSAMRWRRPWSSWGAETSPSSVARSCSRHPAGDSEGVRSDL